MRFWDASALVPLLVDEPDGERVATYLAGDPALVVWWGSPIEVTSAFARQERAGEWSASEVGQVLERMQALSAAWHEVVPSDAVRRLAQRLLRVHPLRAADSLQLAAALIAAEHEPSSLEFVCLDERLSEAARREGFPVLA
ncbi:MAG TPA: type II toxin-antitoxin system VapC family toxin [Steroidobacteraceae bacterium]|nr:type II toxin-antitoxin system VapC family toxin [Steroidobacteraceae bacterium]